MGRPRTWAALGLLIAIVGCGAKTPLADECADIALAPRFELDDGERSCATEWQICRPVGAPIAILDRFPGTGDPDLVWGDRELLVASGDSCGVVVSGVSLEGELRWRNLVADATGPVRITWNRTSSAGALVSGATLSWLDAEGRPTQNRALISSPGSSSSADVFSIPDGFGLLSGPAVPERSSSPVVFSSAPSTPGTLESVELDALDDRLPEHADDAASAAAFAVTSTGHFDGDVRLWDLRSGAPVLIDEPDLADGAILGLATFGGDIFSMSVWGPVLDAWVIWLSHWRGPSLLERGDVFVEATEVEDVPLAIEEAGGRLFVATPLIHERGALSLAWIDTEVVPEQLGEVVPLDQGDGLVGGPRMARTPRGLAIAWTRHEPDTGRWSALVQLVDCCAE